jgi:hypothetical protein
MGKIRIIKSDDCLICKTYIPRIQEAFGELELYDGDAEEHQDQLDEWKIGLNPNEPAYPVVQILNDRNEIMFQFPRGTFSPRAIRYKFKELNL